MMRKYDDEFKQQAVKKILDGQSVASLSRELGVGERQLHMWKRLKIESDSKHGLAASENLLQNSLNAPTGRELYLKINCLP